MRWKKEERKRCEREEMERGENGHLIEMLLYIKIINLKSFEAIQ